jgi:phosphoribosyl-AMP cyclohydrolase / phosphoribosyl-ATP pyrophosphohydrolase
MIRMEDLKWDANGLIPAIVQDADTGEVLTLAYMSRESIAKTLELGETVFYSRSRGELWHKGATSGNRQKVSGLAADCDGDAVVVQVRPLGPACHTGARTCFHAGVAGFVPPNPETIGALLAELERLIERRKSELPAGSYTTRLFESGPKRIFQKVGEEAVETILAGLSGDRQETVREVSDLLFHLLVALRQMGIPLSEIAGELRSRRK